MYKELYQIKDKEKREKIKEKLKDKEFRKKYFETAFYSFCRYYFPLIFTSSSADFHKEWSENLRKGKKSMIVGFRESGKRMYLLMYLLWVIAYKKKHFIAFYSYEQSLGVSRLRDVVIQLKTNKRFIQDFGELFPDGKKKEEDDVQQKSIPEFITNNKIKVKALSISTTSRGLNYTNQEGSFRPDLLCLDDIDVTLSVKNRQVIDKNYDFLKGEVFGGLDSEAQIVFLGNIISNDGLVPRLEQEFKDNKDWYYSRVPVIENGKITWDRFVLTDEEREEYKEKGIKKISLEEKQRDQGENYNPNFLLIPSIRHGNPVFDQNTILGYSTSEYTIDLRYKDLRIYQKADSMNHYYYGVDTSKGGVNGDYSTIVVRDQNGKLACVYQSKIPPDILATVIDYIVNLGYGKTENALIGIENNNTGLSTIDKAKGYWWKTIMYKEKEVDTITGKKKKKYGFNTNGKSKVLIITSLEEAIRKKEFDILDTREKDDFVNYYYDDGGSTNALSGKHDDLVMAEAICLFMMKQKRTEWI